MTPQAIATLAASLGFDITLDGETVRLDEDVWVLDDESGVEAWDRYVEICRVLHAHGLDMPFGLVTIEHDHISGVITAPL
jgi:hypothetical protein